MPVVTVVVWLKEQSPHEKQRRIIFSGGSSNNIHLLVDAPRKYNIARSSAAGTKDKTYYYRETVISEEAQKQIAGIIRREKQAASGEAEHLRTDAPGKKRIYTVDNRR